VQPPRKPWWQQATALVSLGTGGAITGFAFAHGTPAHLASPASVPVTLTALDQVAQPGSGQAASDESVVRSAIVKVASYYAKLAETKTPAEMEALIWQQDSTDGADHGQSCAAFASMTLQLGAQLAGKESWVTGGSTYPWPLHDWVDARVDPNSDSLSITSIVQDAEAHQRWHPLGSSYQPLPGDWVLFDNHVEVVTGYSGGVLSTIGGDSLPNFSVNAHEYSRSLSSEGVQGFVSNGDLPAAATAAAKSGSTGASSAGASSASTSSASRGKTAAGSAAARKQATPATPQDDQQAEEALAAIPGTLAAQQGSRSAGSAGFGSASNSAAASSVAAVIPGVPAGSASPGNATSGSAGSAASSSSGGSSSPAASTAAAPSATSSSPAASSPASSGPASSSSGTSSTATPKATGRPRAKASAQPKSEPSASIPGLPIPQASAARSSKAKSPSSAAAGSSSYARHQTSASSAAATPGSAAQRAFINQIAPGAIAAQQTYGVPAAVTIAQAIDESGWGQSSLASEDYNLFGIKGTGPAGSVALPTQEVYDGQTVNITADFRVYHDVAQSIDDHGKLLAESGSYSAAMASKQSPNSFANALTGVYATDPGYGSQLIDLMRKYNLYRYDASAASSSSTAAASGAAGSSPASASAASRKSQPHGATQSHPASRAKTTTRPTAKATSPSLAAPAGSSSARVSAPPATTAPAITSTAPTPATPAAGSSAGSSGAPAEQTAPTAPTAPDAGSPAATAPLPVASASTSGASHGTGTSGAAGTGNTGSTAGTPRNTGTSDNAGTSGTGEAAGSGDAAVHAGASTTPSGAGTSGAATSGGSATSGGEAQIPGIPARTGAGSSAAGGPGATAGFPAEASTSAAVSSSAPATDAELTAVYQPAPKAPAARKAAKRKAPGPKARRAAPRYQLALPAPVKNALLSSARKPLSRAEYVYRDVAASAGLSWKILAACDWMQCDAHPRYSPVRGEKLGTVNPDGTVFFTKSEALTQSAHDLITLAGAVYDIDLTAPLPLSVPELANVFAAYRWGGLLRQHSTSAMEFPYSVQGLTDQFMHMRWPKIADPNAPDKPGSKYRRAFGAVPVVLSLDYPAIVL
jgi:flagellum-specific peptidoglycan hydrolase FlgJ